MACIFCYMPYVFFALWKRPFSRPLFLTKNMTAKNKNQKKSIIFVVSKPKPPHRDERKYRFEQQKTVHNHTGI